MSSSLYEAMRLYAVLSEIVADREFESEYPTGRPLTCEELNGEAEMASLTLE